MWEPLLLTSHRPNPCFLAPCPPSHTACRSPRAALALALLAAGLCLAAAANAGRELVEVSDPLSGRLGLSVAAAGKAQGAGNRRSLRATGPGCPATPPTMCPGAATAAGERASPDCVSARTLASFTAAAAALSFPPCVR